MVLFVSLTEMTNLSFPDTGQCFIFYTLSQCSLDAFSNLQWCSFCKPFLYVKGSIILYVKSGDIVFSWWSHNNWTIQSLCLIFVGEKKKKKKLTTAQFKNISESTHVYGVAALSPMYSISNFWISGQTLSLPAVLTQNICHTHAQAVSSQSSPVACHGFILASSGVQNVEKQNIWHFVVLSI